MPEFGLPDTTLATIRRILAGHPDIEKAILYGSRAKGNYRPGSDIDLALFGAELERPTLAKLSAQLDESPIPYQVDLTRWDDIENESLREHIMRAGVVFYELQPAERG